MSEKLAETINIAGLLAPLTDPAVGEDLRADFSPQSLYYRLRDARAEARAIERASDTDASSEAVVPNEWRMVRQLGGAALLEKTKDLEIAAWLTEALVRLEGLPGLAVGARLMAGLVENFWDQSLYPVEDEDGIVTRVAPVTGLNGEGGDGTLMQPLRKFTFFTRLDGTAVAFWQFDAALKLQGEADQAKKKLRLASGVLPFEDVERDAKAAGGAWFAGLRSRLREALTDWTAMGEIMDAKAGRDSPPTGRVREILQQMIDACARYAPEEVAEIAPVESEETQEESVSGTSGPTAGPVVLKENREDMLKQLGRIADFFRRTEPHSPLAYTLDDAVRRGRLTWPELLAEVMPDEAARKSVLVQLGIKPQGG